MIKFFRKIRQNMIKENPTSAKATVGTRVSKYMLYAIGEIFLVAIGILIALQVNNWNEQRKNKIKEILVLKEILKSIDSDLVIYSRVFDPRLEEKKSAIIYFLDHIGNNKTITVTNFLMYYDALKTDVVIRFDNGPFEALKSLGLETISNNTLRALINNTYQVSLPSFKLFTMLRAELNNPQIDQLEAKIMGHHVVKHKDGQLSMELYTKVNNILENENFLLLLGLEIEKYDNYYFRLNQIRTLLKNLKTNIYEELNHHD